MYLNARTFLNILLFCALIPDFTFHAIAAKHSAHSQYQEARVQYYSLLSSQEKIKNRNHWLSAARKFYLVYQRYPGSKEGADALYTQGLIYENMYKRFNIPADGQKALEIFQRTLDKYPNGPLAGAAERHIGDIKFLSRNDSSAEKSYSDAYERTGGASLAASKSRNSFPGVTITDIKRFSRDGYTRFIIALSGKTAFRSDRLEKPGRVYVDFLRATPGPGIQSMESFNSGMVHSVRLGKGDNTTRVVFDLQKGAYHSITPLSNPYRLIVDFGTRPPPNGDSPVYAKPSTTAHKPEQYASLAKPYGGGAIKTIVIDPGHGGKDPGAIGQRGLREKHVTLALAQMLAARLNKRLNCRVVLTRNKDQSVELDDRTVLANSLNADLFISIHANSSRNRRAGGMETYFLSPARSQDELETAARENMIANFSDDPAENDIAYIMNDMHNAQKVNESVLLAKTVQRAMVKGVSTAVKIKDKGVKQAMFYVLWRATMPAILVEANFISNQYEERLLGNQAYLEKLSESIADGIIEYTASYQVAMNN